MLARLWGIELDINALMLYSYTAMIIQKQCITHVLVGGEVEIIIDQCMVFLYTILVPKESPPAVYDLGILIEAVEEVGSHIR